MHLQTILININLKNIKSKQRKNEEWHDRYVFDKNINSGKQQQKPRLMTVNLSSCFKVFINLHKRLVSFINFFDGFFIFSFLLYLIVIQTPIKLTTIHV